MSRLLHTYDGPCKALTFALINVHSVIVIVALVSFLLTFLLKFCTTLELLRRPGIATHPFFDEETDLNIIYITQYVPKV